MCTFLGVKLGNSCLFVEDNWINIIDEIKAKLLKWKPFVSNLSYRGRTLVINQLCASKLWHKFAVLTPPRLVITELQSLFNVFFWQGVHWTTADVLYLPVVLGGQGVISLQCRIFDFRLKYIHDFLYVFDEYKHPLFYYISYFLRTIGRLNYSTQIFQLNVKLMSFYTGSLSSFCKKCLSLAR